MTIKTFATSAILLAAVTMPLAAQWKVTDKIPRLNNGDANLSAPAPKRADGKPDLTGIWIADPPKLRDATAGLKAGEVTMTPAGQKLYDERKDGSLSGDDPDANCLPQGVPKIDATPLPFKIFQEPGVIVFLYEAFDQFRQVFMDGRALPKDPNPQWFGYSVGKWEGDTLVVESIGFNGRAWLDQVGHPSTEALHVIERFRRRDLGHMEVTATVTDPGVYTKPWTFTQPLTLMVDTELLELVCNENNRDLRHLKGKQSER